MFEKNMKISYLLDFYGDVLDERVRAVMDAYYDDDLSLSEIADGEGISRQGVRHLIKKGEEHLLFLEEKLGLANHHGEIRASALSSLLPFRRRGCSYSFRRGGALYSLLRRGSS